VASVDGGQNTPSGDAAWWPVAARLMGSRFFVFFFHPHLNHAALDVSDGVLPNIRRSTASPPFIVTVPATSSRGSSRRTGPERRRSPPARLENLPASVPCISVAIGPSVAHHADLVGAGIRCPANAAARPAVVRSPPTQRSYHTRLPTSVLLLPRRPSHRSPYIRQAHLREPAFPFISSRCPSRASPSSRSMSSLCCYRPSRERGQHHLARAVGISVRSSPRCSHHASHYVPGRPSPETSPVPRARVDAGFAARLERVVCWFRFSL